MSDISIQEAAILAGNMKRKLRAFEKIEEVVKAAAGAKVVMDKHTDELKAVQADIVKHQAQLDTLKDQVAQAQLDLNEELKDIERKTKEEVDKQAGLLDAERAVARKEINFLHLQQKEERESLEAARAIALKERDKLESETKALEMRLDALRAQAAELAGV